MDAVPEAIRSAGVEPGDVIGIASDFTACTMVPTTDDGTPLCELPEFAGRPHAYVKLWKHHDYFGRGENKVMHHLRELRRRAHSNDHEAGP
jgi:ribulose kinase